MQNEKNHHGRFTEGFFWGAVIGGAAAYVLSHKKGREFIKELFQNGVDFLEEKAEKAVEKEVFTEQDAEVNEPVIEVHTKDYEKIETEETPQLSTSKKRFFKKVPKSK